MWILPLCLLITFELIADVLAKQWSIHPTRVILFIGAMSAYLTANWFWLFALKNGSGLARGAVLFSISSGIIALLLGILVYKEELSSIQMGGMLLGLISVILICWNG